MKDFTSTDPLAYAACLAGRSAHDGSDSSRAGEERQPRRRAERLRDAVDRVPQKRVYAGSRRVQWLRKSGELARMKAQIQAGAIARGNAIDDLGEADRDRYQQRDVANGRTRPTRRLHHSVRERRLVTADELGFTRVLLVARARYRGFSEPRWRSYERAHPYLRRRIMIAQTGDALVRGDHSGHAHERERPSSNEKSDGGGKRLATR